MKDKEFDQPLNNITINAELVEKVSKGLNPGKSMGLDEINPLLLKTMSKVFSVPLAVIFQESICSGTTPKIWKDARVTPLFKKSQKSDPGNYRPVSLTPVVCKCLETIIRAKILEHLVRNKHISVSQFGFHSGRACILQFIDVMEDWSQYIEDDESWNTIYLDFSKAFDSVTHKRLLHKISAFDNRESVLSWIQEFLTGRI